MASREDPMAGAACVDHPLGDEAWFAPAGPLAVAAAQVCRQCPALQACDELAREIAATSPREGGTRLFGIWAARAWTDSRSKPISALRPCRDCARLIPAGPRGPAPRCEGCSSLDPRGDGTDRPCTSCGRPVRYPGMGPPRRCADCKAGR